MRGFTMLLRSSSALTALATLLAGCGGSSDDGTDADADRGGTTKTVSGTATDPATGSCLDEVDNTAAEASHVDPGTTMTYIGVPPVSGKHWSQAPDITGRVYESDERPELGELVHSQEHGWTIVWYDDTIAGDEAAMSAVEAASDAVNEADAVKVVFVPWSADDGGALPRGTHVAITHWGANDGGLEYRQFCADPSADAVLAFVDRHPYTDAFEPNSS